MNIEKFIDELNALLDRLDEVAVSDDIEELNATLEDVLFMLSESDDESDFADELADAVEELNDLSAAYRAIPETAAHGDSLSVIAARISLVMLNS